MVAPLWFEAADYLMRMHASTVHAESVYELGYERWREWLVDCLARFCAMPGMADGDVQRGLAALAEVLRPMERSGAQRSASVTQSLTGLVIPSRPVNPVSGTEEAYANGEVIAEVVAAMLEVDIVLVSMVPTLVTAHSTAAQVRWLRKLSSLCVVRIVGWL